MIDCAGLCVEMGNSKEECPHKDECVLVLSDEEYNEKKRLAELEELKYQHLLRTFQILEHKNNKPQQYYVNVNELSNERDKIYKEIKKLL